MARDEPEAVAEGKPGAGEAPAPGACKKIREPEGATDGGPSVCRLKEIPRETGFL